MVIPLSVTHGQCDTNCLACEKIPLNKSYRLFALPRCEVCIFGSLVEFVRCLGALTGDGEPT